MMTAKDLVSKALDIARNYKTLYVMGCFGAPLTGSNVSRYCTNHSYNCNATRTAMIKAAADQSPPVYGFDCVCLIKGILWGWSGNPSKTYGGAVYTSNDVPDIDANQMIKICPRVSADFRAIVPGAVVWMKDHIGIYAGDGLAVECFPKWENKVQITAVANVKNVPGYNSRTWTQWGMLPYVDYKEEVSKLTEAEVRAIIRDELTKIEMERADLPASDWAKSFIDAVCKAGVMSDVGGSIERPRANVTREEMATVAANILSLWR